MTAARCAFAVLCSVVLAGCEAGSGARLQQSEDPGQSSPAVARFRQWTQGDGSGSLASALRDSLAGRAAVLARDARTSTHTRGAHSRVFEDSAAVSLELTATSWDSAMAVTSAIAERFLDSLAPGGEPLELRAPEPLPLGGARWRWLTPTRAGELRLRGEPRPGWPRQAHWRVTVAITDRPATAYDRGLRPREVREASRVARWFESLPRRTEREPSTLVRWAVAAGARTTGMDGHAQAIEGGRFADQRTLRAELELQLGLDGLAPDSLARAMSPFVEAGLREALGAHGQLMREAAGRWAFEGRGRRGSLVLQTHRDAGGRDWLDLSLVDGPLRRR